MTYLLQCVAVCWCCSKLCSPFPFCSEKMTRLLQCVAVCCSVLQCVAVCCSVLQCVAVCCSVLQCLLRGSVFHCLAVEVPILCPSEQYRSTWTWTVYSHQTALYSLSKKPYMRSQKSPILALERDLYVLSTEPVLWPFKPDRSLWKKLSVLAKQPYIRSRKSPMFALQIAAYSLLKEPYIRSRNSPIFALGKALYSLSK